MVLGVEGVEVWDVDGVIGAWEIPSGVPGGFLYACFLVRVWRLVYTYLLAEARRRVGFHVQLPAPLPTTMKQSTTYTLT